MIFDFQDVTGVNDVEKCRSVLEQHNWDIEVSFFFGVELNKYCLFLYQFFRKFEVFFGISKYICLLKVTKF